MDKEFCEIFLNKFIGVELSATCFYRGILLQVSDEAIVLELLNNKKMAISLNSIQRIKEMSS